MPQRSVRQQVGGTEDSAVVLLPPINFYNSLNDNLLSAEQILDIVQNIDLKKKTSMRHYFPLPEGRMQKQRHPKPPNHVIAADSWKDSVMATAAYTLLSLERQREGG